MRALVDGSIPHEGEGDAASFFVPLGEGHADTERQLAADDAVAAVVADGCIKKVHRPALALGTPGGLAKQLGETSARVHPERQAMAVAAVAVDEIIAALVAPGG